MAFDIFGGVKSAVFGAGGTGGLIGVIVLMLGVGIPVLVILFFFFRWIINAKKYNIDLEIKIPRSDGRFVNAEWGRGYFDTRRGVFWVKRKGKKPAPVKPFEIQKYIQGTRIVTMVQTAPLNYKPVLTESYLEMQDDETGEEATAINVAIDTERDKAWGIAFESEAKAAYTITSLLREYAQFIGIGLILLCNFVGFAILWSKVG